jgi:lysophospholipase L1-like esterase
MTDGATCTITYKTNETAPAKFDNPLYGKIALFDGDSFCAAGTADGKGWAYLIGEANAMSYTNYGVAGATVADITGQEGHSGAHCICKSIDTMAAEADYIVLEGGVNDYLLFSQYGFPLLGAVSTGYAATLDETTFCGAMESLCKKALTKYVGKKILFIIAHKTTGSVNATAQDWFNKQREILEKWNIPYVDLYKTAGICVQLSAQNSLFHDEGGGTYWGHLTASGYIAVTPKIESKMKSI